jgi:hypothetical protein
MNVRNNMHVYPAPQVTYNVQSVFLHKPFSKSP